MKKALFIILALIMAVGLAIAMAAPTEATVTGNLLNNPGAETGNMSSWAIGGNGAAITQITESTGTVQELSGTYFFTMGMGPGPSSMSQSVDLTSLGGTPVTFEAGGWVQTEYYWNGMPPWGNVPDPGNYDKGKLIVEFFDSGSVSLGQLILDPVEHPVRGSSLGGRDYAHFTLSGNVPANASSAKYKLEGYLIAGGYINVFLDNLYFKVSLTNTVTVEAKDDGNSLGVPVYWSWDLNNNTDTTPFDIAGIPDCIGLTLTAPVRHVEGSTFYVFDYWSVNGTDYLPGDNDITFDVDEDLTATAHYNKVISVDKTLEYCSSGDPDEVPLGIVVNFSMTITVHAYDMVSGVYVEDGIGADLVMDSPSIGQHLDYPDIGQNVDVWKAGKGKMGATKIGWTVGEPTVCEDYMLDISVHTGLNPKGKQEYTSTGVHYLNSGPEVYFTYEGNIYMIQGPSVIMTVVAED